MKAGDKVWVFSTYDQKVVECDVVRVNETDEFTEILFQVPKGYPYQGKATAFLGWTGFESREALCEHYRKIFAE